MLPGIGGVEYLVIAALIIIFVGPKDLPTVLRTFGKWWGKLKNISREFKKSIDTITYDTGIDDIKSTIEKTNPKKFTDDMRDSFNNSIKEQTKEDDGPEKNKDEIENV